MVTIYNTTLSATSQRHFSDGLGGGDFTYIHNINLLGLYPSVSETYSLVYCPKRFATQSDAD